MTLLPMLVLTYWLGLGLYVFAEQWRSGHCGFMDSVLLGLLVPLVLPWALLMLLRFRWQLRRKARARIVEWNLSDR